jgi:predicted O-methyltransferase YrrM
MMGDEVWNAERLLRTSGSYWEACTLHTGVSLEVFTRLGDQHLTAKDFAVKIGASERGVTLLLNALTSMGLLVKQDNSYRNTAEGKELLIKDSPRYCGSLIAHHAVLINYWSRLPQAVTSGQPVKTVPYKDEDERETFLMGMFNLGMASAPRIAELIDLSGRHHLLDLGGGPGTYAIHFCMANPALKAVIFDFPESRSCALRMVKQFNLEDRVDFMAGNYLEEEIGGVYDVAWLSHILHAEGKNDCKKIIQKTVSVMEPGGLILIHDFILDDSQDKPLFPALFGLNMLINTPQGQSYSGTQIEDMLCTAGLKDVKRIPYRGPNDAGIICGTV